MGTNTIRLHRVLRAAPETVYRAFLEADGSIKMDYRPDPAGSVPSPIDADGASLVIHAQRDDEQTDPSGNSGARIACAVLAPPR